MTDKLPSTVSGIGRCLANMSALPHFLVSKLMKPTLPSLPGISSLQGDWPRPSAPSSTRLALSSVKEGRETPFISVLQLSFVCPKPSALCWPLPLPPNKQPHSSFSSLLSSTRCGGTSLFRSFPKHPLYILPVCHLLSLRLHRQTT